MLHRAVLPQSMSVGGAARRSALAIIGTQLLQINGCSPGKYLLMSNKLWDMWKSLITMVTSIWLPFKVLTWQLTPFQMNVPLLSLQYFLSRLNWSLLLYNNSACRYWFHACYCIGYSSQYPTNSKNLLFNHPRAYLSLEETSFVY